MDWASVRNGFMVFFPSALDLESPSECWRRVVVVGAEKGDSTVRKKKVHEIGRGPGRAAVPPNCVSDQ